LLSSTIVPMITISESSSPLIMVYLIPECGEAAVNREGYLGDIRLER